MRKQYVGQHYYIRLTLCAWAVPSGMRTQSIHWESLGEPTFSTIADFPDAQITGAVKESMCSRLANSIGGWRFGGMN